MRADRHGSAGGSNGRAHHLVLMLGGLTKRFELGVGRLLVLIRGGVGKVVGLVHAHVFLEDFQVRPQDIAHKVGRTRHKLFLTEGAHLLARDVELTEKVGGLGAGQGELPDGPAQPVAHMFSGPMTRVFGDGQSLGVLLPRGVGSLQHLVHLVLGAGG